MMPFLRVSTIGAMRGWQGARSGRLQSLGMNNTNHRSSSWSARKEHCLELDGAGQLPLLLSLGKVYLLNAGADPYHPS